MLVWKLEMAGIWPGKLANNTHTHRHTTSHNTSFTHTDTHAYIQTHSDFIHFTQHLNAPTDSFGIITTTKTCYCSPPKKRKNQLIM